jgi:glutathione S-transferase
MSASNNVDDGYCLYQSPVSYYSVKVRSYLRYKGLNFSETLASDKVAKDIIKPATGGWRVIPVLETPQGKFIQDSSIILDELESIHKDRSISPPGLKQQAVSSLFELLGDEWLVFRRCITVGITKNSTLHIFLMPLAKAANPIGQKCYVGWAALYLR